MAALTLLVAAIDFGTTYSGWAFSFRHDFEVEPTKIFAKQWTGSNLVSAKGPTCVLIKPDGQTLHSFGFEAENKFAELVADNEHEDWYFFHRFKMMLFEKETLQRNVMLEDSSGKKKLPAKTVFSLSIQYLKDDLITELQNRIFGCGMQDRDIQWVLTVPAIWTDSSKQFMREAAQEAGIPGDKLNISLEPEAASLFCRHYRHLEKSDKDATWMSTYGPGRRYLVLDAGGGTVDVTVHEVMSDEKLKEIYKASGGAWGGTKVDDAFYNFLSEIAGTSVMAKFKAEYIDDYLDLFRSFEIKKRKVGLKTESRLNIELPVALVNLVNEMRGEPLQEAMMKTHYSNQIRMVNNKLRIDSKIAEGFFEPAVNSIIEHVKSLLKELTNSPVDAILMVGGFSESPMLQETVQSNFPELKVIIPYEAGLAVVKGAVIFGHSPTAIVQRVSKYTYGTDVVVDFDPDTHPLHRRKETSDGVICENVFSKLTEAGQILVVGEAQYEQTYKTITKTQKAMGMDIYASIEKNPKFIDDVGCIKIGTFSVPVSGSGKGRKVTVKMIFGGTENDVVCTEVATGKITHLKVDFLT
ncbi:heat shock 70 kDa protein 12A-like [Mercenaria mercenaria]|uniref:heat shock 70 kDa protein 12A-like n=1 Tax=Mercenaria mercenaria TaxID=6596 RepID=UPI00234F4655|nr:heat shock 70 kDa protein 12A-like [Mercenaria mercenaria]